MPNWQEFLPCSLNGCRLTAHVRRSFMVARKQHSERFSEGVLIWSNHTYNMRIVRSGWINYFIDYLKNTYCEPKYLEYYSNTEKWRIFWYMTAVSSRNISFGVLLSLEYIPPPSTLILTLFFVSHWDVVSQVSSCGGWSTDGYCALLHFWVVPYCCSWAAHGSWTSAVKQNFDTSNNWVKASKIA
jgi:hypothetical protein